MMSDRTGTGADCGRVIAQTEGRNRDLLREAKSAAFKHGWESRDELSSEHIECVPSPYDEPEPEVHEHPEHLG